MPFKFPTKKVKKPQLKNYTLDKAAKPDAATGPRVIQGKMTRSIQEWYFAIALSRLNIEFIYGYEVFGGFVAGGYEIDFLLPEYDVGVELEADVWHQNDDEEQYRRNQIESELGITLYYFSDKELPSVGAAINAVRGLGIL